MIENTEKRQILQLEHLNKVALFLDGSWSYHHYSSSPLVEWSIRAASFGFQPGVGDKFALCGLLLMGVLCHTTEKAKSWETESNQSGLPNVEKRIACQRWRKRCCSQEKNRKFGSFYTYWLITCNVVVVSLLSCSTIEHHHSNFPKAPFVSAAGCRYAWIYGITVHYFLHHGQMSRWLRRLLDLA